MVRLPALRISVVALVLSGIFIGCNPTTTTPDLEITRSITKQLTISTPAVGLQISNTRSSDLYFLPPYYPESYQQLIEASKDEDGVIIYSNLGEEVWKPVIEAFQGHFPWIEVNVQDLGTNEVFDRYSSEVSLGERSADLVASYSPDGWIKFANAGHIEPYVSEEDFYIPPWTKLAPGIYTIASDPLVILYNKDKINNPPQSMSDVANLVEDFPEQMAGKITSYDATQNSTGEAVNWFWTEKMGQSGWEELNKIGESHPIFRTSASSMVNSIISGENLLGYFISPISFLNVIDEHPEIDWSYIKDGQPILMRSIAITRQSSSPNSAKLMLDYLLSQEGQVALTIGGMTPYRSDMANVALFSSDARPKHIHFNQVIEAVGLDNLIFINLDPSLLKADVNTKFIDQWNQTMKK